MQCSMCELPLSDPTVQNCPRCSARIGTGPHAPNGVPLGADGAPVRWHPLRGPMTTLFVFLACELVTMTGSELLDDGNSGSTLFLLSDLFLVGSAVSFLVWLYRARRNVEASGYPQRRARGWAMGAWFVPVVSLWFPYQVVADVRRGDPAARENPVVTRELALWWTAWLLSLITATHFVHGVGYTAAGATYDGYYLVGGLMSTLVSKICLVVAGVCLVRIVRAVSATQEAQARTW